MNNFIDYSQYKLWYYCPWAWYERYVIGFTKKWPKAQRDDALAIGTLVHVGLEKWQRERVIDIPLETIEEIGPTPEALAMCKKMVYGWTQKYQQEQWELVRTEEPLRFPLIEGGAYIGDHLEFLPQIDALAKLDAYFYVPELTPVESGIEGYNITLTPGWWIYEYKTKADTVPIQACLKKWETNMQASFQVLALQHALDNEFKGQGRTHGSADRERVQGVLVNYLEKPRQYIPMRKCKNCAVSFEFASWTPTAEGLYKCPACENVQKLKPYEPSSAQEPSYFRLVATRDDARLARDLAEIQSVAQRMEEMREFKYLIPPNRENCISPYNQECAYYSPHTQEYDVQSDLVNFEPAKDYVNEVVL